MACITTDHPIHTGGGWTLASQAISHDQAQPPYRACDQLCGLQLTQGGNTLINTSSSQDQVPTFIEAATMGYHFSPPSGPHPGCPPTYSFRRTGPREEGRNPTGLSYSQVTTLFHQGISMRPIPPHTPLNPAKRTVLKGVVDSAHTAQEHNRRPMTGGEGVQGADPSFDNKCPEKVHRTDRKSVV